MTFVLLAAGILATWRVTHLLVHEDGPWDVFRHIRTLMERLGAGRLLGCFLCASVWVAIATALLLAQGWRDVTIAAAAFSSGAILLQRLVPETPVPETPPAVWMEEKESA